VRFVGKHLPFLKEPGSENAAVATMAAHRQDAFWRYRDHLFVHQHDNWSVEKFVSYAKTLGLDLDAFKKDLADPALRRHVRLDKAAAKALSIRATPTLFVNGRLIPPNAKPQQVRRMIRKAAAEVRGLLARGKAKTVAEARGIVAAKNHASGELFARYYMDNDVRDLIVAN
jgi:protein-disulfide isomerase